MTACINCGANIASEENFCGTCGARQTRDPMGVSGIGGTSQTGDEGMVSHYSQKLGDGNSTMAPSEELRRPSAKGTGELAESEESPGETSRAGEAPPRRQKPKALAGGKVLNHRYEIVRRIGGGGMGAVYLAKDKNLGDAARAVKEMIESHLDDAQHEKAIADFKRESLLLTELEHPCIPTVYDYF